VVSLGLCFFQCRRSTYRIKRKRADGEPSALLFFDASGLGARLAGRVLGLVCFQGVAELVHAGGGLGAAGDAAEPVQDEVHVHAFDHGGDGLEVALAAAGEIDVVDAAVVDDEVDLLGADIRFRGKVLDL